MPKGALISPDQTTPVVAVYKTASAQSISHGTGTIVNFDENIYDTHNFVSTGTAWKFQPNILGYYVVSSMVSFAAAAGWADGENASLSIYKNTAQILYIDYTDNNPTNSLKTLTGSPIPIYLNGSSDYIDIRVRQISGGTLALLNNALLNWVAIYRIT